MATLVTGGAGFIGSTVVDSLLDRDVEVHVFDDFNDFYNPQIKRRNIAIHEGKSSFHLHEADLLDRPRLEALFEEHKFDRVIHLAARAGVRPSVQDPLLYQRVNVEGTLHLLELARHHTVERFIFASSSSVYGNNESVPFSEDDRVDRPISPYAATKLAGESLCHTFHHLYGTPIVCLRFFTAYGPRQRPEMAIHAFTDRIEHGRSVPIFGDGSSARDYTFIQDVVSGVLAAYDSNLGFEIINLGSTHPIRLLDLVSLLEKTLDRPARIEHHPMQAGDVRATCADLTRAQELLGYEPRTTLEEGIESFVNWYRSLI